MPRDGSGTYSLPAGNPVVNGTVIDASVHNTTNSDIASELTNSIDKSGKTTVTGNIPMGGFKLTNVAAGSAVNQNPLISQIQDGSLLALGSVSGTDTITAALTPAITSYAAGASYQFKPAATNTGAVTIAINGLAAKTIVKGNAAALVAGDLASGVPAMIVYDGTNFELLNPQHNVANDEVTFARMQNIATDTLIGRATAGTGDPESITCTAAGRALIDDADAATQRATLGVTATGSDTTYAYRSNNLSDLGNASTARTNLGLGSLATANSINGGNWSGTDLAVADGGTGASDAATARSNLGLGSLATASSINGGNWSGTDLAVADGGTGGSDAATARSNLGAAASATTVSVSGTGLSGGGDLSANRTITIDQTAMATRNVTGKSGIAKTLSTSTPSGGSDGDIWYRY